MDNFDSYTEERELTYKGEAYSVRDNGVVMRHAKTGKKPRSLDNLWTLGKVNTNNYLYFSSIAIHRLVCIAFHGEPPSSQHVVDHIDTNHLNNRPENLRWLTKLQNTLNNPITRKKVIQICGSVEAFLEDPSLLYEHENEDPNFKWMRFVTKEEAKNCLEHWEKWQPHPERQTKSKGIGEWIFKKPTYKDTGLIVESSTIDLDTSCSNDSLYQYEKVPDLELAPNVALGPNWKTPTNFPLCPSDGLDLNIYLQNLTKDSIFSTNKYGSSIVLEAGINNDELIVATAMKDNDVKSYGVVRIFIDKDKYVHDCIRTCFSDIGCEKYYTLAMGQEWTGGDCIDDYC